VGVEMEYVTRTHDSVAHDWITVILYDHMLWKFVLDEKSNYSNHQLTCNCDWSDQAVPA